MTTPGAPPSAPPPWLFDEWAGASDWVRADVDEHVRDEHSTFTWLLEPMAERAGFAIRRAEYPDDVEARDLLEAV